MDILQQFLLYTDDTMLTGVDELMAFVLSSAGRAVVVCARSLQHIVFVVVDISALFADQFYYYHLWSIFTTEFKHHIITSQFYFNSMSI